MVLEKTTTIRMLAGVLVPTAGRVSINGIDLVENPIESKRHVGIFQIGRTYMTNSLHANFLQFVGMYGLFRMKWQKRGEELLHRKWSFGSCR